MQAAVKTFFIALGGLLLASYLGYAIGEEQYIPAAAVTALVLFVGVFQLLGSGVRLEAFVITGLICGYVIGGKAFAYLSLGGPLFMGEVVLAFSLSCFLVRTILTREPLAHTGMALPLVLLVSYGGIHLLFDFPMFRLDAIRDSALIYYIAYFLLGLSIANDPDSVKFVTTWVLRAIVFACLVVHPLMTFVFGGALFLGGRPIIGHTSDTMGNSYLVASIYFYLKARSGARFKSWLYLLSALCLIFTAYSGRSTYTVAAVILMVFLWACGYGGFARRALVGIACGVLIATFLLRADFLDLSQHPQLETSLDHLSSLVQPFAENRQSVASETISWRLTWWKTIASSVWHKNPALGFGFGGDISSNFFEGLYGNFNVSEEHLRTRSPHSVLFTTLGRLGIVGVACFAYVVLAFITRVGMAARIAAKGWYDYKELSLWCLLIVTFVSAFFSVVLEGPTGAIPFWTILGVLLGTTTRFLESHQMEGEHIVNVPLSARAVLDEQPMSLPAR